MTTALRTFYEDGQLVEANDLNNDGYTVGKVAGDVLACFFGAKETFPAVNPLTVTPATGLSVVVGGDGEQMIVRDADGSLQLADYLPAQTLTFAPADPTQARIDTIAGVYFEVGVGAIVRDYCDPQDTITPGGVTSHYVGRSMQFSVVTGTPGSATPPPAPAGMYVIAHVTIGAGATSLTAPNVETVPLPLGAQLSASGANLQAVSNDHSIDIVPTTANGQSQLNFQADYDVISQHIGIAYEFHSNDGSILITKGTPDPKLPPNALIANFQVAPSTATTGGTQTPAGQAGLIYCSFRTNIGTQSQGLEDPTDQSFSGLAAPRGYINYIQLKNIPQCAQYEFGLKVKAGAGPQPLSSVAFVSGNFFVALDGVIVFGPVASDLAINWTATIPDDGQTHTLVFHCDNNLQSAMIVTAWVPYNASGGVDATKFEYVGPITHYP